MIKFLVDAQLPFRLAKYLTKQGFDVLHTTELELGNQTTDDEIVQLSIEQSRIVVTKDSDFIDSFLLNKGPYKLLWVQTGNSNNNVLLELLAANLECLSVYFLENNFIELGRDYLVVHC